MKKLSLWEGVIMLLSLFVSCTSVSDEIFRTEDEIMEVVFTLPNSDLSVDSRMNIVVGTKVQYNWTNTDSIGIFPNDGYQVAFPLNTTGESSSATFTGGGWALKAGSTYAAYYPFEYNNRRSDSIPVSYLGQKQIGNNSTDLADKYNYMYATGDKTGDNTLTFKMLRLGRFIILKFAVPEPTTLSSVKLTAPEDVFITQGYFNLWDNPHVIESLQTSNSLTIDLEDVKTTEANEEVTVYFFIPPVNLSGKTLSLEVTDEDNVKLQYTVAGKDMTDSKAYALTGVIKEPVVGDGTYQNGIVSLSQAGTMKSLLGDDYLNITSLKVVGPINGDDVYYLRKMLGGDNFSEADWGKLTTLDLSEATIVEGGEYYYQNLGNIYTSNNVIGDYMFFRCYNLQNIMLPNNLVSIGKYAFSGSDALIKIEIPDSVISMGEHAFYRCRGLTSVIIGDGVDSIGYNTFSSCFDLESITIGIGVTSIDYGAFSSCSSLSSIYISDISSWCNIDIDEGFMVEYKLYLNNKEVTKLIIPEGVTEIKKYVFKGCKSITEIIMSKSVNTIGESAFRGCDALTSLIIGENVTTIDDAAFKECSSLANINIPDNVISMGSFAFEDCTALTSVTIGNGVTTIEGSAFRNCSSLISVSIGKNVETIKSGAFGGTSISTFYSYATIPPGTPMYHEPFNEKISDAAILYVPARCGAAYNSSYWGYYFENIIEMD